MIEIAHGIELCFDHHMLDHVLRLIANVSPYMKCINIGKDIYQVIFLDMNGTNKRLLDSVYFDSRLDEWFTCIHPLKTRIPLHECNEFKLTYIEVEMLENILKLLNDDIVYHGWFDVLSHK